MTLSVAIADGRGIADTTALRATLSGEEQGYFDALAQTGARPRRAGEYLVSRWLLRRHAATVLDCDPSSLAIDYLPAEAPMLAGSCVHLGLAHSRGICLSLVSTQARAGCDIELLRSRRQPLLRIAEAYFAAEESAALAARDPAGQQTDFHRLWTLKEATLKCMGHGLAGGLSTAVFSLHPELICSRAPGPGPWRFASQVLDIASARIAIGIAVRAEEIMFQAWQFLPQAPAGAPVHLDGSWACTQA